MYLISVYDWSAVTTPANLTADNLAYDLHGNDPNASNYDPTKPSWLNQTYTYTSSGPIHVKIADDDAYLQDNSSETGAAATLLEDVTLNGVTYSAGSQVSSEFSLVDSGGNEVWIITIDGVNVGFAPQVPYYEIPTGSTFYPVIGHDNNPSESGDGLTNETLYSGVVCMAEGTRLDTPNGPCPVEDLTVGAQVLTLDHGPQPVVWIGAETHHFLRGKHGNQPIRFAPGALGLGRPSRPLYLSPQHRVLLRTGDRTHLAPAIGFLGLAGVRRALGKREITYFHVLCAGHQILMAEGLCIESLYLGDMTRAALGELPHFLPKSVAPARPCLTRNETQRLLRIEAASGVSSAPFLPVSR